MYSGEQAHQLDAKNRIRIPAKFQVDPDEKFVFCKGATPCIYVMPKATFEKMANEFSSISIFDEEGQEALSEFMSSFYPVEPDGQGRILIPEALRKHASINKNVVTVGVFDRLEIWSEEVRESRRQKTTFSEQMKKLAERVKKQ